MLKRVVLVLGFLSIFSTSFAQHEAVEVKETNTHGVEAPVVVSEADQVRKKNKDFINHHLLDAHSFDIMVTKEGKHIGFPLPVIFYDQANGFHAMMSSAFHHGEEVVESKGGYYKLFHEKIYKTDASGTINLDEAHHPTNEKVLDLSITKSVLMVVVVSLLMILILLSICAYLLMISIELSCVASFTTIISIFLYVWLIALSIDSLR